MLPAWASSSSPTPAVLGLATQRVVDVSTGGRLGCARISPSIDDPKQVCSTIWCCQDLPKGRRQRSGLGLKKNLLSHIVVRSASLEGSAARSCERPFRCNLSPCLCKRLVYNHCRRRRPGSPSPVAPRHRQPPDRHRRHQTSNQLQHQLQGSWQHWQEEQEGTCFLERLRAAVKNKSTDLQVENSIHQ
jgi:hypothetical protein